MRWMVCLKIIGTFLAPWSCLLTDKIFGTRSFPNRVVLPKAFLAWWSQTFLARWPQWAFLVKWSQKNSFLVWWSKIILESWSLAFLE